MSALTYLSTLDDDQVTNVTEMANNLVLPKELLAKILSELVKAGLAVSYTGVSGGFRLARNADDVSLADIINALEKKPTLIECVPNEEICGRFPICRIRRPMERVNDQMEGILRKTTLSDFTMEHHEV